MALLMEPRRVEPGAWRRWVKVGGRLGARVGLTLLPLSVIVGLAGGAIASQLFSLAIVPVVAMSGVWQAAVLGTAERAAQGKRVDVGTAGECAWAFWRLPDGQAWQQVRARAAVAAVLTGLMLLLVVLPLAWYASGRPDDPTAIKPSPDAWRQLWSYASSWGSVFLWSWAAQRGGSVAMANMLVRQHGLGWEQAHHLFNQAYLLNRVELMQLSLVFLAASVPVLLVLPWLVFPLEVVWASIVTVAARDIFDHTGTLAPQEPKPASASVRPAL